MVCPTTLLVTLPLHPEHNRRSMYSQTSFSSRRTPAANEMNVDLLSSFAVTYHQLGDAILGEALPAPGISQVMHSMSSCHDVMSLTFPCILMCCLCAACAGG